MNLDECEMVAASAARFGAEAVGRGWTPDHIAAVAAQVPAVLEEAMQLIAAGADPDTIRFGFIPD